jgi:hypothetical protein
MIGIADRPSDSIIDALRAGRWRSSLHRSS